MIDSATGGRRRDWLLAIAGLFAMLQPGCRRNADRGEGKAAPSSSAASFASAAPSAAKPQAPLDARPPGRRGADLASLLCRERPLCTTLSMKPAGSDPATGRERLLVAVRIGVPAVDRDADCVPHEEWLVLRSGSTFEVDQFLISDCSREPEWPVELNVTEKRASFDLGGTVVPSNWIGTVSVDSELSPPRITRKQWHYYFRLEGIVGDGDPCRSEEGWREMGGFAQESAWSREAGPGEASDGGCTLPRAFVPIPIVTLPAAFEDGGWKTTALGDCAAKIDGTREHGRGYTVSGATDGPADASMSVVLSSGGVLYAEFTDDHFSAQTAARTPADQLHLFRSAEVDDYSRSPPVVLPTPARWTVRIADGRVLVAANAPASALRVERSEDRGKVRLRLRFAGIATADLLGGGLAIALGDADPGETDAVIATSPGPLRHPSTLGRPARVDRDVACRVEALSLARSVAQKGREVPLYRDVEP